MRTTLWLIVGIGCLGCAHAPVERSPALAKVEFYVGRWQCAGLEYDAQGAVTKTYPKLEIRVAPAFASWLRVELFDGGEQTTSELKGVDSKGAWHHIWVANDGASGSLTSPGWNGDRLVFEEDHASPSERTRMIFTKTDATHYTHKAEVDRGSGFKLEFEKTCHKT
ncbi:hypothetical protein BH11MYX3_BH11MYX3_27410 [soil metagenome]